MRERARGRSGIELLGGFHVGVGGRDVPQSAWRRRKPAALLKLLALAPGHRLHREQVMDQLWPELAPAAAAANLRKALHQVRRVLGDAEVIAARGELLCLHEELLWVDVDGFLSALDYARRTGRPDDYAGAVELYGGELLPEDRYEEWAIPRREELHVEFLAMLEELAALLEARGDLPGAVRVVRRLVAAEPLREESHVRLIRLHTLAGQRGEALRQYERLRELLAAVLGTEPDAETQRLYEEVRSKQVAEPELSVELWERVGDLRVLAGDGLGAVKAFRSALEVAVEHADIVRLRGKTAGAWLMQHAPDEAELHLRAAEELAVDPAERGRLAALRAHEAWERGELERAQRFAEEARDLGRSHGTGEDVAAAHDALAIVSHLRGDWRQGLQLELGRLGGDGERAEQLARVFDIHHCIGQYHLYGDGLADDVEKYARRTLTVAEEAEAIGAQAFAWCLLGESLLLQARWEEAAGCLERSCELHASLGTRSGALAWQRLAELAVCRGAPDEATALLRRAAAIATVSPMASHLWGRIYATTAFASLERDDPEEAARAVRAAAAAAARYGDCPTCSALLNPIAAEALAALGDRRGAHAHAEAAARVGAMFESSAWRAMAEAAAASASAAEGDTSAARERFERASELYARARQPCWRERTGRQAGSLSTAGNGGGTPAS